jgi:hypothetical protein
VAFIIYEDQLFFADSKLLLVPYLIQGLSVLAVIACWHYTVGLRRR